MGKFEVGKTSILVLLAAVAVSGFLLFNGMNVVSAHDDHNDDHNHPTATPTATPTPTPHDNHDCDDREWSHDHKDCKSPTPTPTATPCVPNEDRKCPTPTPTATPTVVPTPTNDPNDLCPNLPGVQTSIPDGWYRLDGPSFECRQFQYGGPESSHQDNPGTPITGSGTGGQVLGASTMAGTGSFDEVLYTAIMTLGGTLSAFGIKSFKKASK